jgi:hypothetical protein
VQQPQPATTQNWTCACTCQSAGWPHWQIGPGWRWRVSASADVEGSLLTTGGRPADGCLENLKRGSICFARRERSRDRRSLNRCRSVHHSRGVCRLDARSSRVNRAAVRVVLRSSHRYCAPGVHNSHVMRITSEPPELCVPRLPGAHPAGVVSRSLYLQDILPRGGVARSIFGGLFECIESQIVMLFGVPDGGVILQQCEEFFQRGPGTRQFRLRTG